MTVGQSGELFIGGDAVFTGYLHQAEQTDKVLIELDGGALYYRTGDLVRFNEIDKTFYYVGRKDFQVKLRGQRIVLGEIESVIMKITPKCVVIKAMNIDQEHLVAYVETTISPSDLRRHCMSFLPLYMVPSLFVTLEKLPTNSNGKIDRAGLPTPSFHLLSLPHDTQEQSLTETERLVGTIWCQTLTHLNKIPSKTASLFAVGGNSLLLMKLYYKYQTTFPFYASALTFDEFFLQSTIEEHAKLLLKHSTSDGIYNVHSPAFGIQQGKKNTVDDTISPYFVF